ncbi:MAG: RNA 2',3'-cyclic phosphodiesterase [Candidatus Halalkalibacterium sp. M3_1C_030]
MRLFTAITIPEEVKDKLQALKKPIKGLKWQDKTQMHLTLRFIGEIDERSAQNVNRELEKVSISSFSIELARLGSFPQRGTPKVLWIGVKDNSSLNDLHARIELACRNAGLEPDERSFKPHITIARNKGADGEKVKSYLENHSTPDFEPIKVTDFYLFRSELTPQGAVHHIEKKYNLE